MGDFGGEGGREVVTQDSGEGKVVVLRGRGVGLVLVFGC